jgi:hypothetical protein
MSDIEDLNPEHMFDHLKTYLTKKQKKKRTKKRNYLQKSNY